MQEKNEKELSAAMQLAFMMQAFETKVAARRVYHEAPDDVFELIVLQLPDVDEYGFGNGGLNALRLVSKRCMRVVESVATRLTHKARTADSLPAAALKRCKKIQHIGCWRLRAWRDAPMDSRAFSL